MSHPRKSLSAIILGILSAVLILVGGIMSIMGVEYTPSGAEYTSLAFWGCTAVIIGGILSIISIILNSKKNRSSKSK